MLYYYHNYNLTTMLRFAPLLLLILTAACTAPDNSQDSLLAHPNIVIILVDDQGWGDLAHNGNQTVQTPNLDGLANDGAHFEHFFVQPVCSPTRAEMLTGRYHPRMGVTSTSAGQERLDLDELTLAEVFKAAGYATGAYGKWHNGSQAPYHPLARGFDEYYGFPSGHWGHYFSPPLEHNGELVQGDGYVVDDFTDKALEFIERSHERPFLAYLPYNTPHSPMQVPDKYWDRLAGVPLDQNHRYADREDTLHTRAALAMTENIDWNVGRLLGKLDELGIAENTIVMYFSDNGPNGSRWNGDMKGWKGSVDEGGVRSPMIIRWPAVIAPGTVVTDIAAAIDILPTLVDLAGINASYPKPLDGISVAPVISGTGEVMAERLIFNHWRGRTTVRSSRYRLGDDGQLFDMVTDQGQYHDVASENPDIAAEFREARARWEAEVVPEAQEDTRPFTVGHPEFEVTRLPARDATGRGGIERSNRYPNDSFLTNWTTTADSITWHVEVLSAGEFAVELSYTCEAGNEGATIELSWAGQSVAGVVPAAHDPPLVGMADDRSLRIESYVKDFVTMDLGTITLTAGVGTMALRAREIPGEAVIDFRRLTLRRVD